MTNNFPAITPHRRIGQEPFHAAGQALPFDLLSFWQWYASDLTGNALRGCIAAYLVARALGAGADVRQEWDAVDIKLSVGNKQTIALAPLIQLNPERVGYPDLAAAIHRAAAIH